MSELKPGLYRATVGGEANVIVMVSVAEIGLTMTAVGTPGLGAHGLDSITDARPLIVLDLDYLRFQNYGLPAVLGALHRDHRTLDIARQVEAQTKPARIPEPGLWGVVESRSESPDYGRASWVRDRYGWTHHSGTTVEWRNLIDPTLVREGIS